ncbi:MAG: hypothetical protein ACKVJ1_04240, partial [Verrucomicrobiia bacterium]
MKRVLIPKKVPATFIHSLPEAATPALAANFLADQGNPIAILIEESIPKAEEWGEDVAAFLESFNPDQKIEFHLFDCIPESNHPDAFEKICDRLTILSTLLRSNRQKDHLLLIATTPEALISPCPKYQHQKESELILEPGQEHNFDDLCTTLATKFDYSSEILCEEPGQFSVRGGLIDIYPINGTAPARIDFFGNEIEEIRTFDPTTQRGDKEIGELIISSAQSNQEIEFEGEFFQYLSDPVSWILREPEELISKFPLVFHTSDKPSTSQANFAYALNQEKRKEDHFLGTSEIQAGSGIFEHFDAIELPVNSINFLKTESPLIDIGSAQFESEKKHRTAYLFELLKKQDEGSEIIIAAGAESQQKRIVEIIK